jgi:hypothetical protein
MFQTRKLARTAEKLLKFAARDLLMTELLKALRAGSVRCVFLLARFNLRGHIRIRRIDTRHSLWRGCEGSDSEPGSSGTCALSWYFGLHKREVRLQHRHTDRAGVGCNEIQKLADA